MSGGRTFSRKVSGPVLRTGDEHRQEIVIASVPLGMDVGVPTFLHMILQIRLLDGMIAARAPAETKDRVLVWLIGYDQSSGRRHTILREDHRCSCAQEDGFYLQSCLKTADFEPRR